MSHQKAGKYACYEFELRFLLTKLPESLKASSDYKEIDDIYFLGTNLRRRTIRSPEGRILERKLTQKYVSEDSDLSKTIITNIYLGDRESALLDQLQGTALKKNRHKFRHDDRIYSVDEFKSPNEGLVIAEIEFNSQEEMDGFIPPFSSWKDVTLDPKFTGGFLASKISSST